MAARLIQNPVAPAGFSGWLGRLRPVAAKRVGLALGLWGEAGIGKTWTARRLLSETACKGFSFHATAPLTELAGLASALPRPGRLPLWAQRVLERLARGEFAEVSQVADALGALLAVLAPVIVHLEDLHEAGAERLELVGALARQAGRTRGVALLVTSRVQPPQPFEAVRLEPLDPETSRALLENEVGASLPEEATRWIQSRAKGNPLFTLEYLRYLARQGFLWNDHTRWHWRTPAPDLIPLTVEALLERQILEVSGSAAVRKAFEARAILPPEASEELWAGVAGLEAAEFEEARARLLEWGILRGSDFAHPLFREVRLKTLRPERKQALARRALEALANDPEAAAGFVEEAGLGPEQAREHLLRAAQSARGRGNEVQAARFVARAAEYAEGEERGRLALEAARILRNIDLPEATRLAELAVQARPGDSEAVYLLAEMVARTGRADDVDRVLQRLPDGERSGVAWARRLFGLRFELSDYKGALELWHDHPEIQTDDPDFAHRLASVLVKLGRGEEAQAVISPALDRSDLSDSQRVGLLHLCAIVRRFQGDYAGSAALYDEVIARERASRQPRRLATYLYNRSIALRRLGRYQEAMADLEEAMRAYSELGEGLPYAQAQVALGKVLALLGEYERAEEMLLESLAVLERTEAKDFLIFCEGNLSLLYREWGTPHGGILALKYAHAALRHARSLNNPMATGNGLYYAALAEAAYGNPSYALELAQEGLGLAERTGQLGAVCDAQLARATALEALGRRDEAISVFGEAERLANRYELTFEANMLGLELDRLNGNLESARTRLEWFRKHGLMNGVNLAVRYFPRLGAGQTDPVKPVPQTLPRLEVLGPMRLNQSAVRGHKRRELLALLAEARIAGRSEVSTLELLEALYPGLPEAEAANLLKQAVFQARVHLGQGVIATAPGGYALGSLETDAELFLKTGDTRLWRGGFLEDASGDRDEAVRGALYQALAGRVRSLLEPDPREAVRLGRILLSAEPYDPEILALTLRALRQEGNRPGLSRLYREARERMKEVGEALPEDWQGFLENHPA